METIDAITFSYLKKKSGLSFTQSKDYAILSEKIQTETGYHISDNTLRRLMGMKADAGTPRTSTLDIVARYLGYESWDLYEKFGREELPDSRFLEGIRSIVSDQLTVGQQVEIQYHPCRVLVLEFCGNNTFVVRSISGGSLQVGDLLTIYSFVEGMTLFVQNVQRGDTALGQYIAGEVSGLLSIKILE